MIKKEAQVDVLRSKLATRTLRTAQDSAKKTRPSTAEILSTPAKGKAAASKDGTVSPPASNSPRTPPQ